jgi:hypothetical protein
VLVRALDAFPARRGIFDRLRRMLG